MFYLMMMQYMAYKTYNYRMKKKKMFSCIHEDIQSLIQPVTQQQNPSKKNETKNNNDKISNSTAHSIFAHCVCSVPRSGAYFSHKFCAHVESSCMLLRLLFYLSFFLSFNSQFKSEQTSITVVTRDRRKRIFRDQ